MEAMSYCRVSTEEQVKEGVSLAAQEARVQAYCGVAGLSLIDSLRDEGVSTVRPLATRPGGAVLLRARATPGTACGSGDARPRVSLDD